MELEILEKMYHLMVDMDRSAQKRAISWLVSKFELDTQQTTNENTRSFLDVMNNNSEEKQHLLALFACAHLQIEKGAPKFMARDVNDVLKEQGYGITNITVALNALEGQKPSLLVKLSTSTGKKQQYYKLTSEGVKLANAYL